MSAVKVKHNFELLKEIFWMDRGKYKKLPIYIDVDVVISYDMTHENTRVVFLPITVWFG